MKNIIALLICVFIVSSKSVIAQPDPLIERVGQKMLLVKDYVAEGIMKTNVSFIKASVGKVKVYFKQPNLLKIKKEA